MAYCTQKATVGDEDNWLYADQSAHDHEAGIEFSKAIKAIMKLTCGDAADIEMGHFASNQSSIPTGGQRQVQLYWKDGGWTNNK